LNSSPAESNNYIISNTFRQAGITSSITDAQIAAMGVCDVNQTIQYMDGLGRPIQTVQVKASPLGNDIVEPIAYDQYGREATKYLSYVTPGSNNGTYRAGAVGEQAVFYHPAGGASGSQQGNSIINTASPYAQTNFEPSPLNRVLEQGAPGDAWQPPVSGSTTDHTVKVAYGTNASEVILWSINSNGNGATGNSSYTAGTLYKTTTTDENGNNTIEYKDLQGLVVCKMAQNGSAYLATYYVYDDLNNLTYVIPPIPVTTTYPTSFVETDPVFINFIYGYHYDSRNRVVQKKVPGKGWEFMVYNTLDQVVMTQDANQRNPGQGTQQWTFTKYDAQGREIITGIYNYPGSSADNNISSPNTAEITWLQNYYNTTTNPKWEAPNNSTTTGYDGLSDPQGQSFAFLKINYYDGYTFTGQPSAFVAPVGASTMTKGLLTGTQTAVLNTLATGTPDMLWKVSYYDDLGRTTQTYAQHYLGGVLNPYNYDKVVNTYDFANEVIGTTRYHYNATNTSAPVLTVANTYVYDHEGRKKQTWEQIGSGTNVLLVDDEYNEIGQLMTKNLHGVNGEGQGGLATTIALSSPNTSGTFTATNSITLSEPFSVAAGSTFVAQISGYLQTINYAYNERGWLLKINDPSIAPTPTSLFSEQLNYNNVAYGALPQFNGNIAEMDYNASTGSRQQVTYSYDPLNRLMAGTSSAGGFSETGISYDNMGNIQGLTRTAPNTAVLKYSYADINNNSTGNLLQNVTNTNNNTVIKSYQYDVNGNAYNDGTNAFTYNMLNLPQTVTSAAYNITYTYDADGTKLRKASTQASNGSVTTTDYISGIQYKANSTVIDFIQTEEGRVLNPTTAPNYEYTLTDHLGNNRVTFDQLNGKTSEDDYYPFGLNVQRFSNTTNLYLYNKKELQNELTEYDYGARFYDPVIARWTTIDPLIESNHQAWTPYAYVYNNPILLMDPDGRDSTQRAQAQAKAKEFVAKNDNGKGNSYQMGGKGNPGEPCDCSNLVSKSVEAGGEKDPNNGTSNGVTNIANTTTPVDPKDVVAGNIVILHGSTHTGIITLVQRDKDGNIVNEQMIDSGGQPSSGTSGPRVSNLITNGKEGYWGARVDGYRKWDTKPDAPSTPSSSKPQQQSPGLWNSIKTSVTNTVNYILTNM
jgi:RHS repeat-associated protein